MAMMASLDLLPLLFSSSLSLLLLLGVPGPNVSTCIRGKAQALNRISHGFSLSLLQTFGSSSLHTVDNVKF
jgi:hypothetical protein